MTQTCRVAIVNTGVANTASVIYALQRIGVSAELTESADLIQRASHVILPGVGTASASMKRLKELKLVQVLQKLEKPVLGICLGMQLFYSQSSEASEPGVDCLGVLSGRVEKLKVSLPTPHMGWNTVTAVRSHRLFHNIPEESFFYFVHSYYAPWGGSEVVGRTRYETDIPAVVEKDNWFGTQFHPERSGAVGQQLLKNFINL